MTVAAATATDAIRVFTGCMQLHHAPVTNSYQVVGRSLTRVTVFCFKQKLELSHSYSSSVMSHFSVMLTGQQPAWSTLLVSHGFIRETPPQKTER
jgi:hypothetical protein